jgi:hypothetical protein
MDFSKTMCVMTINCLNLCGVMNNVVV